MLSNNENVCAEYLHSAKGIKEVQQTISKAVYYHGVFDYKDLIQELWIKVLEASDRFDPSRNVSPLNFLRTHIKFQLITLLHKRSKKKLIVATCDNCKKNFEKFRMYCSDCGSPLNFVSWKIVSLDRELIDDVNGYDLIGKEDNHYKKIEREIDLVKICTLLTAKKKRVLNMLLKGATVDEVAQKEKISRCRVHRIIKEVKTLVEEEKNKKRSIN